MTSVVNTNIDRLEDDNQSNAENSTNNIYNTNNPQPAIKQSDLQQIQEEDFNISRKGSYYPNDGNQVQKRSLTANEQQHIPGDPKRKPSYFDKHDKYLTSEDEIKYSELPKKSYIMLKTSSASISTYMGIGILNVSQMIIIRMTGHQQNISAFALGLTWINACSYAIIMALNDGIRTVSSQIYGAKKYKILGIVYNQSIAISWTVFFLSLALVFNTERILTFLGIEQEIAAKSQEFTVYGIPSLLGSIYFESSRQFLFAQKIFKVHMNGQLIAAILHPIWCYLLILHFDFGIPGAGVARSITFILSYLFVWIQIKLKGYGQDSVVPFNFAQSFHIKGWIQILKVAIPAGGTNYLKWCSIECLTVLVGRLPNKNSLAGHGAFFSINIFFSMFAKGIQTTVNSFIGNAIGEGKEQLVKNLTIIAVSSTFLLCTILLIMGQIMQPFFIDILTTSPEMASQFKIAYNMYLCVDIWCNFLQQVQAGILSAMNRQNDTVKYYMWTFIVLQFIVAYTCGFYLQWGLAGVWLGRISAGVTNALCFFLIIKGVDIKFEIQNIKARLENTKKLHQQTLKALEEAEN